MSLTTYLSTLTEQLNVANEVRDDKRLRSMCFSSHRTIVVPMHSLWRSICS